MRAALGKPALSLASRVAGKPNERLKENGDRATRKMRPPLVLDRLPRALESIVCVDSEAREQRSKAGRDERPPLGSAPVIVQVGEPGERAVLAFQARRLEDRSEPGLVLVVRQFPVNDEAEPSQSLRDDCSRQVSTGASCLFKRL